jgi:hypothetical protein
VAGYCAISGEHDDGEPLTLDPVTIYGLAVNRTPDARARLRALSTGVSADCSSASLDATPNPEQSLALALVGTV